MRKRIFWTFILISFSSLFIFGMLFLYFIGDALMILPVILLSLLIVGALAFFLSGKLSRRIIKPLLEFSEKIDITSGNENLESLSIGVEYEELLPLASRFDNLKEKLIKHLTEQKDESNKIRLILDKMREGVVVLNQTKDVLLINKSAIKHLGLAQFIPEKIDKLSQEIDTDKNILFYTRNIELNQAIDEVINSGETCILNMPEGVFTEKALRFYVSPVIESIGILGAAIIIRDVTEIIRAENIRSEFVANVSHELKTPVTSIKGFAEILSGNADASVKKHSKIILEQAERLLELVDDILLLSEVESKTKDSDMKQVNVTQTIREAISVLEAQASGKGIKFNFSSDKDIFYFANRNTLFELILNLLDNAIKYNKLNGKVEIGIFETADELKISIFDNGIGIPKNDLLRIFERFYRVDKSRSKKSGGTGLGLSIVKHIVELYRGKIIVESEENEYTKVSVTLPRRTLQ